MTQEDAMTAVLRCINDGDAHIVNSRSVKPNFMEGYAASPDKAGTLMGMHLADSRKRSGDAPQPVPTHKLPTPRHE